MCVSQKDHSVSVICKPHSSVFSKTIHKMAPLHCVLPLGYFGQDMPDRQSQLGQLESDWTNWSISGCINASVFIALSCEHIVPMEYSPTWVYDEQH